MIYSTAGNSLNKQDTSAPGIVLAVAPNNNQLVINDQVRGLFYLYNTSSGPTASYGGMGVAAAWTPDSNTLYIVDNAAAGANHTNRLYVYNVNTGWSTYDLSASGGAQNVAVTVPGIGAYLAGNSTVAHTWCPSGTVGNNASIQFYPQSDSLNLPTSVLGATADGAHMLGASLSGSSITLGDIGLAISATPLCPESTTGTPPNQVETMKPLSTNPTLNGTVNLTGVTNATAVNRCGSHHCLHHHGRAHRLHHLHHPQHVHRGRPAPLLPAPSQRQPGPAARLRNLLPRRITQTQLFRRHTGDPLAHGSALRHVFAR
jgi:hypothetical protein